MNKFTLFVLVVVCLTVSHKSFTQAINQTADWGVGTTWVISGSFYPSALIRNPTSVVEFGFDDTLAPNDNFNDHLWCESPIIDLNSAAANGETDISVSMDYVRKSCCSDELKLQYYDADLMDYVEWEVIPENATEDVEYQTCNHQSLFTSLYLDISGFTATQLSNFRYRFYYSDDSNQAKGFCMAVPTIISSCPIYDTLCESFDSDSESELCWTIADVNGGQSWNTDYFNSYEGNQGAFIYTGYNIPNDDWLISPKLNLTGNEQLRFFHSGEYDGYFNEFEILVSTTENDPSDFTNTVMSLTSFGNTDWEEVIIDLSLYTGEVYVAFHFPPQGEDGYYYYLDEVCFETIPTCIHPNINSLWADNFTSTGADLYWEERGSAFIWDLEIGLEGFAPTGVPTIQTINSDPPFTWTGGIENTSYDFYVRSNCGGGDYSIWSGPFTFKTLCEEAGFYCEGFEFDSTTEECWRIRKEDNTAFTWNLNDGNQYKGTQCASIYHNYTPTNSYLILPPVNLTGNEQLRFFQKVEYAIYPASFEILLSTTGALPNDFNQVLVAENEYSNDEYMEYVIDLSDYTGDVFIAIHDVTSFSYFNLYFDEVCIEPIPSCPHPILQTLSAEEYNPYGADLVWSESGSASTWDLEIGVAGFTPSGIPTEVAISSNPYTWSAGLPNTEYDYYVRANCGGMDESIWSGPFTFKTDCLPLNGLYESFDSGSGTEECWSVLNNNNSSIWDLNGTYEPYNGDQTAILSVSNDVYDTWLISPGLTLTGNEQLRFYQKIGAYSYSKDFEVLLSVSGREIEDFTEVLLANASYSNESYQEYILDLSDFSGDIHIAFHSSGFSDGAFYLDEIYVEQLPTCPHPNPFSLSVSSITNVGADLHWTESGTATTWDLEIGLSGFDPIGLPTETNITSNPFTMNTGLPNTSYDFYVRSYCGVDDESIWSGPFTFKTDCDPFLGFCESFDSDSGTEDCWTLEHPIEGTGWYLNSGTSFSGDQSASIYSSYASTWMISPTITVTGGEQLRYYHKVSQDLIPIEYDLLLSTSGRELSNFTTKLFESTTINNGEYEEVIIDLSSYSGDINIAWYIPEGTENSTYLYIDEVCVETIPTCPKPNPTLLTSENIFDSQADLIWTESGSANIWDLEIGPGDFSPTGLPTDPSIFTTTYTWNSGMPESSYDYYVRADCGLGEVSDWSGPHNFETSCAPLNPFCESFDSDSTTDQCWSIIDANNDSNIWKFNNLDPLFGDQGAVFYGNENNDWLISPTITLTGSEQLRFYYKVASGFNTKEFEVLLSTTGVDLEDFDTVLIPNTAYNNDYYKEVIIDLSAYTGNVNIAWHLPISTYYSNGVFLDEICVELVPSCTSPGVLSGMATNISSTGAELSWDENGSAFIWDLEIGEKGFIPTGTPTDALLLSNPYSWNGGVANTEYEFYVRSNCGMSDYSDWVGPFEFKTNCDPFSNLCESFNSSSTTLSCWNIVNQGGDDTWTFSSNYGSNEGDQAAVFFSFDYYENDDWLISPPITLTGNELMSYYHKTNANYPYSHSIKISTTGSDLSNFTEEIMPLTQFTNVDFEKMEIDLTDYSGEVFIAIHIPSNIPVYYEFVVDDFCIDLVPDCLAPTNLSVSDVTLTEANLQWEELGDAQSWDIEIGLSNFIPSGIPTVSGITNTEYFWDAGSENTQYEFYVRSDCGMTEFSEWSGPHQFNTTCESFNLFCETFDSNTETCWTTIKNGTNSNEWVFDTNVLGNELASFYCRGEENDDWLISPLIELTGNELLRFDYSTNHNVEFELRLSTAGKEIADFDQILIASDLYSNNQTKEALVNLSDYTGPVYLAWYLPPASLSYYSFYMDNICIETMPLCPAPVVESLTANYTTDNGAELMWSEFGTANIWDVEIVEAGLTPTGIPTESNITSNAYLWSLGDNDTEYDFYVRSNCISDGTSSWTGPLRFKTDCSLVSNLCESFEPTSETRDCWKIYNVDEDQYFWNLGNQSNAKSGYFSASIYGTISETENWLISPTINLTGNEQLSFYHKNQYQEYTRSFEVKLSSTGGEIADFTTVILPLSSYTNHEYEKITIDLSGFNGPVNIAVIENSTNPSYTHLYFDDICIETIPTCPSPSNIGAVNISTNGAELIWTEMGSALIRDFEIGVHGFSPTGVPTDPVVLTSSYIWSGGQEETSYDFYVRSNCGAGDESEWKGPYTFTTLCEALDPFCEDFELGSTSESCWTVIDGNQDLYQWNLQGNFYNAYGSQAARIFTYGAGTQDDYLISPKITLSGSEQLRFYHKVESSQEPVSMEILLSTTGIDVSDFTTTIIPSFNAENINFQENIIDLSTFTGDVHIAIRTTMQTEVYSGLIIDDFCVEIIPTCPLPSPTSLYATSLTDTSADLGWIETGSATAWDLEIGDVGFNPTGIPTASGVGANPFTFVGLPNRDYDFYVRANCGGNEQSDWSGPFTFSTLCSALMPFCESFNQNSVTKDCWIVNNANQDDRLWVNTGSEFRFYSFAKNGDNDDYLISPKITLTGNEQLRYFVKSDFLTITNDYEVLLSTTGANPIDFTATLKTNDIIENPFFTEVVIDLSSFVGEVHIAWHIMPGGVDGFYLTLDDVCIEEIPSCPNPSMLSASNFTPVGAELKWEENGLADIWDIEIMGSITVPSGEPTFSGISDNIFTWTGGNEDTEYKFYVRSYCGMDDESIWAGPFYFRTSCLPVEPEYCQNFNGLNLYDSNGMECWQTASDGTIATGPMNYNDYTSWFVSALNSDIAAGTGVGQIGSNDWFISPTFDLGNTVNYQVSMDLFVGLNDLTASEIGPETQINLLIKESTSDMWDVLQTWSGTDSFTEPMESFSYYLGDYSGVIQLAFHISTTSYITESKTFWLDNFCVEEFPCPPSLDLVGTNLGDNSDVNNFADNESSGTITSGQLIASGLIIDYDSETEIILEAPFEVEVGAIFEAFIDGCNNGAGGSNFDNSSTQEKNE